MGNSRSKAAQANKNTTGAAWTTAGAVAADRRALDDSSGGRSKRNHGKKNSPSSSSKKQGKTKREKKKNGSKIHRNSRSHQTNSLTRQDSYNKAILQHEQQQQQQQHLLPEVAVVIDHSMTTSTHSQPAVPATTTSSTPTSTTPATMNSAHPVGAVPQLQEEETIIIPRSMHASLVRSRDGEQQPVHQIYDIEHEIGHGSGCLCKVFRIQKKQEYIGGSSRPQNVVHGQNTCTTSNASKQKWFIKTLQSLGTITIRAPVSPSSKKGGAGEDEQGDDSHSDDPWNSPDLRFLFRHHDSNNRLVDSSSSENDDSATSRDRQQRQQHLQQQLQTTTMTASTPVNDVATTTATTTTKASTTPSSSSLSATTTTTTVDVMSSTGNDTASITKGNSNNTKPMYFALKVINLVMVKEDKIAQLKNEVEILKTLDHPNIIQVYETFNTKRQVMMIMELCTGGDLHTRMPYTELQVAGMMRQILSAIRYIHARHIVHRDIKLENIMFESTHLQGAIKVIDFGLSKNYSTNSHHILTERVGTLYSMSPETMRGIPYTTQADLWSIGVVTFILLANGRVQPFEGRNPKQVVANVLRRRFSFDNDEIWGHISQQAKDFISSLLVLEPNQRLTASTAREHEWFAYCKKLQERQQLERSSALDAAIAAAARSATTSTTTAASSATQADASTTTMAAAAAVADNETNTEDGGSIANASRSNQHVGGGGGYAEASFRSIDKDTSKMEEFKNRVRASLVEYAGMGEFRKLALNVIAKKSSSSEIFEVRKVFEEFDYLGTGTITLEEFSTALSQFQYSPRDIHKIFSKIDVNRDNAINYTEFVAACLETQGTIEEYRLAEAFDILDEDDSGYISHENLRKLLPPAKYSDAYIDQLIAEGDFKGDGVISYEDFLQVFAKKKHDRIEAIYYESGSCHANGERKSVTASQGGEDGDDDDDDESSKDSSRSTEDVLRRYGILQTLRRGFGSSELLTNLVNKSRSRILSSDDTKNTTTQKEAT